MKTICLSHYLNDHTPGFGGQKSFFKKDINLISKGKSSNSQEWTLSNHIGTHIDLPSHFDDQGKRLHQFVPEEWFFDHPFLIQYPAEKNEILYLLELLNSIPKNCDILILKTNFQRFRNEDSYWKENPGLAPELGDWLRKNRPNIRCIGFDFISITAFQHRELGRKAHKHFLHHTGEGHPILAIEDMNLEGLKNSPSRVVVAPLFVEGADGAPVTVFAFV